MTANNKKGFTIIEVVLVLAIAGLIFLMVFIALPALQRSQRNTQREDDLARVLTGVNNYQTNNNGKVSFRMASSGSGVDNSQLGNFVNRYIDSNCTAATNVKTDQLGVSFNCSDGSNEFRDPQGEEYWIVTGGSGKSISAATNVTGWPTNKNSYGFIGFV